MSAKTTISLQLAGGPCQAAPAPASAGDADSFAAALHQPSQVPLQPQHAFQNRYTGHLHPAQQQVLPTQSHASQLQSPAVAPHVAIISSSPPVLWQVPQALHVVLFLRGCMHEHIP